MAKTPLPDKFKALKTGTKRFVVLLCAVALMLLIAWVMTLVIQSRGKGGDEPGPQQVTSQTAGESTSLPEPEAGDSTPVGDWNVGPEVQDPDAMQLTAPDHRMIALPENGRVDMSYFDTVTFVGDSLTQGLQIYDTIPGAVYCAYRGISPKAIYDGTLVKRDDGEQVVPMEAIVESAPDNVYVLLGANAMASSLTDDAIIEYYRNMLDALQENLNEGVGIYIQTITPVRPDNKADFDPERISGLNDRLAQLAWEEDVYFIDLSEVLMDEEGYLREEYAATDGYHLHPSGYEVWRDYLLTHTAYHPRNPYLEGSPYYTG